MIRQRTHPAATQGTSRLEAFTDGVFAIAATLLVLDLTTHAFGEITSDAELWAALAGMWKLFFNFALSFVLLCMMWMVHVQQFEHVARIDGVLTWLNNARLLFIVLVPFATSLTTEYSEWMAGRLLHAGHVLPGDPVQLAAVDVGGPAPRQLLPDISEEDARAYGRGR